MVLYSSLLAVALVLLSTAKGLEIYPNSSELILTSGADVTLACIHDAPIKWIYQTYGEDEDDESSIKETRNIKENGKFKSMLSIRKTYYLDTGFYYCVPENESPKGIEKEIYVFVRDDKHLFAIDHKASFLVKNQYESLIIPCKPTSPDVKVTLYHDLEEVTDVEYNEKQGFIIKNLQLKNSGNHECKGTRGVDEEIFPLQIVVHTKTVEVERPRIKAPGSPIVPGQGINLECTVSVPPSVMVHLEWEVPNLVNKEERVSEEEYAESEKYITGHRTVKKILTIRNVMNSDEGTYACRVIDNSNNKNKVEYHLKVVTPDMKYLNLTIEGKPEILVRVGESKAQWIVDIAAHPQCEISWYDPRGNNIPTFSGKYKITTSADKTKLEIHDLSIMDSGVYQLVADNDAFQKILNITLFVEDKPNVKLDSQPFYMLGNEYFLRCAVIGYPIPKVKWIFQECSDYPNCSNTTMEIPMEEYSDFPNGIHNDYHTRLWANTTGFVTCEACNFIGCDNETIPFWVTDIRHGFHMWNMNDEVTDIVSTDDVNLECGASIYIFKNQLTWFFSKTISESVPIYNTPDSIITKHQTNYSYRSVLQLKNITKEHSGLYICKTTSLSNEEKEEALSIFVKDMVHPFFKNGTNMNSSTWNLEIGHQVNFICIVSGVPRPKITWFKDGKFLNISEDDERIRLANSDEKLQISYTVLNDDGLYSCQASSKAGIISAHITLHIKNSQSKNKYIWIIIVAAIVIVLSSIGLILLFLKVKREQKLRRDLTAAGLYNFADGQIESLNPELDIHEQADLLPYDKKWEFPRDKLKLGKQLGSGEFGVVLKAEAYGLREDDEPTIVAVKMVKKNSEFALIKALASELKIMAHLGQHLNVLNLIGSCTGNINNRELLVLVEYCRYGNLHNYLLKHRDAFINQINPENGTIEPSSRDKLELSYLDPSTALNTSTSNYSNCQSVNTDITTLSTHTPIGDDGYLVGKEPDWRSNYQGDYKTSNVQSISTQDLLCWGYQVARGMEYLASRKVLHGDLAARNILLAEGNIVKICDFGLAKSIYKSGNYCKKGDDLFPVKWMSIEALRDRVFSTQSDIWAFGIVLWEMFSLAKTPYPGIGFGRKLFNKLLEGYRMEKPEYATNNVYNLMKECWAEEPMSRPSFTKCAERLGSMLEESVKQHYIDLNGPYMQFNSLTPGQSDYLSMLNAPTFLNYCSVNDENAGGSYLNMQRSTSETADEMELKPMLPPGNNYVTTLGFKSFLNPGYEGLNRLKENTYINVPQEERIHV